MSKAGFIQAKSTSTGAAAIIGGEAPPVADTNGREGWAFVKTGGSAADLKINWYYWNGTYANIKLKHMKSLFILGSIDTWTKNGQEAFFINVYTKMTGSGDAGSWFHSKHSYLVNTNNQTITAGERCIFHALDVPKLTFDGARPVLLGIRQDEGTYNDESEILVISVHTDSSAPSVGLLVENMGVDFHQHEYHTNERTVNLKVIM